MPWKTAVDFIKSARGEMERVHWPSRELTMRLTTIVIILTAGVGIYIGLLDLLLTRITQGTLLK